nr:intein [Cafeteria roenbergensis virus BV-PW1]
CFTPDTPIFTNDGFVSIENIKPHMKVMTSDGTFRNVNKIFKNNVNKNILKINTTHSLEEIKCTKEHDILIYQNINNESNYEQITHYIETNKYTPNFVKASELKVGDFMVIPKIQINKQTIYSEDDYYLLGLILGKGTIVLNKDYHLMECMLTLDTNSISYQFVKNYLTTKNICFSEINNNSIIEWNLPENFIIQYDDLYINDIKYFSSKFITGETNKLLKLIKGLIDSNGNIDREITVKASNKNMAYSIRYILMILGIPSSGHFTDNYIIKIPKTNMISNILNIEPDNTFNYIELETCILTKIENIDMCEYSGYVYDLNIEENHNYLTSSGIVHN